MPVNGTKAAAAVRLVTDYGFHVFPCDASAKTPRTRRGVHDATSDENVVENWFSQLPDSNIGVACGRGSRLFVVDIDTKTCPEAIQNARDLLGLDDVTIIDTMVVKTPSGGQHWYFRLPEGAEVGSPASVRPGVDIRGEGGYVVAPPSSTEIGDYTWLADWPLADPPQALLNNLADQRAPKTQEHEASWGDLAGVTVSEGSRNHALTSFAGALWNVGVLPDELLAALRERNKLYEPPLPDSEVNSIAKSAVRNFTRPTRTGFQGIDYNVFASLDLPPVEFLLEPMIARGGVSMIHAAPGVGKTMLAIAITAAVATGSPFLTWRCDRPGQVFYCDGEMLANAMQSRFEREFGDRTTDDGRLTIANADLVFRNGGQVPDLSTPDGRAALDAALMPDTELIVIDNVSAMMRTGDENSNEFWQQITPWTGQHRAAGRAVLIVHHDNKGKGTYRGHSKIDDGLDTRLHLTRPDDYEPSEGVRFIGTFKKSRLTIPPPPSEYRLTADGWTVEEIEDARSQAIAMRATGMPYAEIAEAVGKDKSTVWRWLQTKTFEEAIPNG